MLTLGLDIGTTTISGVVLDRSNHKIIESNTIPNDSFINTPYAWERIQNSVIIVKNETFHASGSVRILRSAAALLGSANPISLRQA